MHEYFTTDIYELYSICTCQHTQLPEDGCSLQPKHVGTLKPTVQLAGNNLVCMTV